MTAPFEINQSEIEFAIGKLEDLRPALAEIGVEMLASAEKSFRVQALGTKRWPGRGVPNIAGIISDLNRGATPPKRRFESRPAGIDTGKLRQSIGMTLTQTSVKVDSRLTYSKKYQEGGKSTLTLTKTGKESLKRFLADRRDLSKSLGWMFRQNRVTINQKARPFLGITKELRQNAIEILEDHIGGLL